MTLSVMVKESGYQESVMVREPGYQDGTDIGGWTCYLVAGVTPLTNSINVDYLGIILRL